MSIGVSISGSSVGLDVPIPEIPGLEVDVSYNIANNTFSAGISEGCGIASVFIGAANIQDVNGHLVGDLEIDATVLGFTKTIAERSFSVSL